MCGPLSLRLSGCPEAAAAATVCWDRASGIHAKPSQGKPIHWGTLFLLPYGGDRVGRGDGLPGQESSIFDLIIRMRPH